MNRRSPAGSEDRPIHTFHSSSHSSALLRQLQSMRDDSTLCDVTLQIEECRLCAHKLVLAAVSPFFAAMFTADMRERKSSLVELKGVDSGAVESLVEFAYSSQVLVSSTNAPQMLAASDMLQFTEVKQACCVYLQHCLNPVNCLDMLVLADTHACSDLQRASQLYCNLHFTPVSQQPAFLQLALDRLEAYLCSDYLRVEGEGEVLEAALRWLKHDVDSRSPYVHRVLSAVRLPLLPPRALLERVWTDLLVSASPQCMELLRRALVHHLYPTTGSTTTASTTPVQVK